MPQEVIDQVNKLGVMDKQLEQLIFFDWLGRDIGNLQMHDPSTAGVHDVDDETLKNLNNDPITVDDEVLYAVYPDEPGDDDPDDDPNGDNIKDPNPDVEPDDDFGDFNDRFDSDLDPFGPGCSSKTFLTSEKETCMTCPFFKQLDLPGDSQCQCATPRCAFGF
jgi:hypothetical protein